MDERSGRFEALVREVAEPVRRFLARRTDAATADDVLAETLLVCWRRFDEVPDEPLPWVYAVARNCLANAERGVRRQHRLAAKLTVLDPPREAAPDPVSGPGADAAEEVRAAIATLTPTEAELIRLWAWEGLGPSQIATVLDLTPNAVSIRLHRAREKLRERLRKTGEVAGHEGVTERRKP